MSGICDRLARLRSDVDQIIRDRKSLLDPDGHAYGGTLSVHDTSGDMLSDIASRMLAATGNHTPEDTYEIAQGVFDEVRKARQELASAAVKLEPIAG